MPLIALWVLTAMAAVLAVLCAVFAIETVASLLFRARSTALKSEHRARIAVLVPAHNEAAGIAGTLDNINGQLQSGDRLLVVADNCSDDTANIAATKGAEVSIRFDATRIGKGYALDWGLRQLEQDPPNIVIVLDADCRLTPFAIDHLASACQQTDRPVQALYLMTAPPGSGINHQVAEFAWRVKNLVRPLGLMALGLPCQLMGTGMAFPWAVIRSVDLGSGHIVEDLKLGLDLARAGCPPLFCPAAQVTSTFPTSAEASKKQRQRWEHGQLALVCTTAIPLLLEAIRRRNFGLLILVFDLLVPPLSLFVAALTTTVLASALLAFFGQDLLPLTIGASGLIVFGLAVVLAWMAYGRSVLPAKSLALIPSYLLTKASHYASALRSGRTVEWVRTDRS
jgi:cellulose synthase/poly-beta-1,6-N-acetylglucosamine synthase-like glycosyltransferase